MAVPYPEPVAHSTPSPRSSPNSITNKWGPYSSAGDFTANMIIALAVLFCVLLLILAINAVIRFLLCNRHHRPSDDPEKQASRLKEAGSQAEGLPTVVFSPGTKLAGDETECAICLAEFLEGDGIRILPACNHGFHVRCIERWLATRRSCPTCRASFHEAAPGKGKPEET